jgi:ribosomal protein L39E
MSDFPRSPPPPKGGEIQSVEIMHSKKQNAVKNKIMHSEKQNKTCPYWKSSLVVQAVKKRSYPYCWKCGLKEEKKNLRGNSLLPYRHSSIYVKSDLQKHFLLQENRQKKKEDKYPYYKHDF